MDYQNFIVSNQKERSIISIERVKTQKIVNEYDQEIPQPLTADKCVAPRGYEEEPHNNHGTSLLIRATAVCTHTGLKLHRKDGQLW